MCSVRNVRRVTKGKNRRPHRRASRHKTQDSLNRRCGALSKRSARVRTPDRDSVHKHFYHAAKIIKKWSEKGAKAWASLQVEELRRTAVAVIAAESNGSAVASSKMTAYRR